jgi:hypothetical protein
MATASRPVYGVFMIEVDDSSVIAWLPAGGNGPWCGFDAEGWRASSWILHAMYETDALPVGITHDDEWRIDEAATPPPDVSQDARTIRELLTRSTVIGCPAGKSERPPGPWKRLLWSDLSQRLSIDPFAEGRLPGHRSFPFRSWPVNIRPPAEGALDREQYRRLLGVLTKCSVDGPETECIIRYGPCWDMQRPHTFRGTLDQALRQYDDPSQRGAPNNIWPADRSWFIYTDYDLWATKVSGSEALIAAICEDDTLETHPLSP